jgi:hypothetical protein
LEISTYPVSCEFLKILLKEPSEMKDVLDELDELEKVLSFCPNPLNPKLLEVSSPLDPNVSDWRLPFLSRNSLSAFEDDTAIAVGCFIGVEVDTNGSLLQILANSKPNAVGNDIRNELELLLN